MKCDECKRLTMMLENEREMYSKYRLMSRVLSEKMSAVEKILRRLEIAANINEGVLMKDGVLKQVQEALMLIHGLH